MKPKLTVYRVAEPGLRTGWNRYFEDWPNRHTRNIGAFLVTWRWCWSLQWSSA